MLVKKDAKDDSLQPEPLLFLSLRHYTKEWQEAAAEKAEEAYLNLLSSFVHRLDEGTGGGKPRQRPEGVAASSEATEGSPDSPLSCIGKPRPLFEALSVGSPRSALKVKNFNNELQ